METLDHWVKKANEVRTETLDFKATPDQKARLVISAILAGPDPKVIVDRLENSELDMELPDLEALKDWMESQVQKENREKMALWVQLVQEGKSVNLAHLV